MRLVADSGLWSTDPTRAAPPPLVAVLEVSGAVLSWIVDDPPGARTVDITFMDLPRADWLWRVVGESGHVELVSTANVADGQRLELPDVDVAAGPMGALRRLALGQWLRRWWPASRRGGIPALDRALLDAEVAVLTADAQGYFSDDTFDSDVAELLTPHADALVAHVRGGDPRVVGLVRAAAALSDDVGVDGPGWAQLAAALDDPDIAPDRLGAVRDDYALAAGEGGGQRGATAIARGGGSISWSAVPPGVFDASEDTVEWSIEVADAAVRAFVRAAVVGPGVPAGIAVRLDSGTVSGAGELDGDGRAVLPLVDGQGRPLTELAAWDRDWSVTSVAVGAYPPSTTETPQTRERVRRWARARLDEPADDAFLAEILAAEATY